MSIDFYNHKYVLADVGSEDYYVSIQRTLRIAPLPGMKQPTPSGAFMGRCTMLKVLYMGRPAASHTFTITKDGIEIKNGILDHNGEYADLSIDTDSSCQCLPYDSILNKRLICDIKPDKYSISFKHPQEGPSEAQEKASEAASVEVA